MRLPSFESVVAAGLVRGIPGSARALFLLRLGQPLLVVCRGEEEAARLHGDLGFFAPALGSPPPVLVPAPERRLRRGRLDAFERIAADAAVVVVAGLEAATGRGLDVAALAAGAIDLRAGADLDPGFLAELLAEMGYRRVTVVADTGELAVRHDRIDVFPAAGEHPVRIEHAAGRVTLVRAFDVGTQRTFRDLPGVRLLPALEPDGGGSLFSALAGRLLVADGDLGPEGAGLPQPRLILEENVPPRELKGWRGAGDLRRADRREHDGGAQRQDPEAHTRTRL